MTTFHLNSLPKEKRIQMIGEFYDVIDSLKDRKEVGVFFKSILTPEEIAMLMRRIEIAILLQANFSYDKIVKLLGVGKSKIAGVQRWLQQDENGYKIIIDRLIENRKSRLRRKNIKQGVENESRFKKTHPLYFMPFLPSLLDLAIEGPGKENEEKFLSRQALYFTPSLKTKF